MYYSINLENGLLYTVNPKHHNFFEEEDIIDYPEIEDISFKDLFKKTKEKLLEFINSYKIIKDFIITLITIPTIPEVASCVLVNIF